MITRSGRQNSSYTNADICTTTKWFGEVKNPFSGYEYVEFISKYPCSG